MNKIPKDISLFAFDLDGTLYFGESLIEGAIDLISFIQKNYNVVFFTNNSTKTRKEIHSKLIHLGFKCNVNEVFTSSYVAGKYLSEAGIDNVYVIGSEGLRSEILDNGIRIIDNSIAENLIVGLDLNFSYNKIETAMTVIMKNGKFIVCNEDKFFPVEKNKFMPACGAMVGSLYAVTNKSPDFIVGKPNTYFLSKIQDSYGIKHHEIVVVGDSYESDIMMAINNNSTAVLLNSNNDITNNNVLVIENPIKMLRYLKNR